VPSGTADDMVCSYTSVIHRDILLHDRSQL